MLFAQRVAEEEEGAEPEPEPEPEPLTTEQKIQKYSSALAAGMDSMKTSTFWSAIETTGAVDTAAVNPYNKRPLPYVIGARPPPRLPAVTPRCVTAELFLARAAGTAEYHDDDKCGLDYEEEIPDDASESDSDLSSDFSESSDGELSDDSSETDS